MGAKLLGVTVLACAVLASGLGNASDDTSARVRRDDIARVQEALGDPDPVARLANMEAIVKSGDTLKIQVALRTALTSDDEQLRGLAMQAYIARTRRITFDIVLSEDQRRLYDDASAEPDKLDRLLAKYRWARIVAANAGKIVLNVAEYKFGQDTGTLQAQQPQQFNIDGDRFSAPMVVYVPGSGYACFVDFRPTNKAVFEGTLSCNDGIPRLPITARAF